MSSGEGINMAESSEPRFLMATHMKNDRKMGEIIRKIGHLERKLHQVKFLGIKEKNNIIYTIIII